MARGRTVGKTGHHFSLYLRRCGLTVAALFCVATFAAPGAADDDPVKATLAATVNGAVLESPLFSPANGNQTIL